ncbi:hypothetical protein [Kitasatospora sp. MMS16-BH015]|uniref:hypothetical protein n=1 Tax=Kitasatospora sp. MMS16-BH015 TaxID=2018025 RepID=UPI000CF1FAC2|nr:hypothetical protein [Kitasatospora sp. MMS16-BH015]
MTTAATLAALAGFAGVAPAWADTLLETKPWACEEPYSGELECGPAMPVPPGAYLWVGAETAGPTIFTAYSGEGDQRVQIGWGEMYGAGGAFRLYTNDTDQTVLVHITEHADAPENRCGTRFEQGTYEVRI